MLHNSICFSVRRLIQRLDGYLGQFPDLASDSTDFISQNLWNPPSVVVLFIKKDAVALAANRGSNVARGIGLFGVKEEPILNG
jgi:hypothetical protein